MLLNVLGEGVLPGGIGDQSAALQAADTKARTEGKLLYIPPNQNFRITQPGPLHHGALLARGATITYGGSSPVVGAVKVGASGGAIGADRRRAYRTAGWWCRRDEDVGRHGRRRADRGMPGLRNLGASRSRTSLSAWGPARPRGDRRRRGGCAYNTFYIGWLENNQINHRLAPVAIGAYTNQNTFIGGRFSHVAAEPDAGTKHCQLVHGRPRQADGWLQPNNNLWLNPSFEGLTVEYDIDCDGCEQRVAERPRSRVTARRATTGFASQRHRCCSPGDAQRGLDGLRGATTSRSRRRPARARTRSCSFGDFAAALGRQQRGRGRWRSPTRARSSFPSLIVG